MTEENFLYRTSPLMLRNQFPGTGAWHIPTIPKATFTDDEFIDLRLIGFDRARPGDDRHTDWIVHFFLYDYKFERVWKQPEQIIERLKSYRAVLSPDFSMYLEMNPVMQLYNVFRNRWCGAYLTEKGFRVIPTVSWGDESTFDFCFEGIPKGSTVAVSTYMVSEHGHHADQKDFFMKGYRELLRRVEPERIICYNEPFPEMEGNIVYVNYELSSWKYQNEEYMPSKYLPYICGEQPLPMGSDLRIKSGYVLRDSPFGKGMGSAYGGAWKPKKPGDERFLGIPGEVKRTTIPTSKGSYDVETKIGPDGRATRERHLTDHFRPDKHSNPHDHEIDWSQGFPDPQPPTNYPDGEPDFKNYVGGKDMSDRLAIFQIPEANRFTSISDFKMCMLRGGEVVFEWKGIDYCCFGRLCQNPGEEPRMVISQAGSAEVNRRTEMWCDTPDELLEYMVGDDCLRDVITQVTVWDRPFS